MSRNCPAQSELEILSAGRLTPDAALEYDLHLQECRSCSHAYDQLLTPMVEAIRFAAAESTEDADEEDSIIDMLKALFATELHNSPASNAVGRDTVPSQGDDSLSDQTDPAKTATFLGPYRLIDKIDGGGMGTIHVAEDTRLGRKVAIKRLKSQKDSLRKRFLLEARAAAKLNHDNIVPIFEVNEAQGEIFIVMPLLDGMSLGKRLRADGAIPQGEGLDFAIQAAQGLAAAHEAGLVHRDVKPDNLWLEKRDDATRVRLLDFGLVSFREESANLTREGVVMGSPHYMAPEQTVDSRVDHRADLFGLGCVFYHMFTGQRPFRGDSVDAILWSVRNHNPPSPHQVNAQIPAGLSDLILRLLAKTPERRPQSARELVLALRTLVDPGQKTKSVDSDATVASLVDEPAPALKPPLRRATAWPARANPYRLSAAVLFLLFLAGVVVIRIHSPEGITKVTVEPGTEVKIGPKGDIDIKPPPIAKGPVEKEAPKQFYIPQPRPKTTWPEPKGVIENSIGMKLVPIKAGKFMMGSPEDEPERSPEEKLHEVEITRPFCMGMFEVTMGEFESVFGYNPARTQLDAFEVHLLKLGKASAASLLPMCNCPQTEAWQFCLRLSESPAEKKAGRTYRLPTEAEWEYCCRAGTNTPFAQGPILTRDIANIRFIPPYNGAPVAADYGVPLPITHGRPNAWGLYNMHGNHAEWCSDYYEKSYYLESPRIDPTGPKRSGSNTKRVVRGGSYKEPGSDCRSASRRAVREDVHGDLDVGFRVVCVIESQKK